MQIGEPQVLLTKILAAEEFEHQSHSPQRGHLKSHNPKYDTLGGQCC
jgi:hypothetical protein